MRRIEIPDTPPEEPPRPPLPWEASVRALMHQPVEAMAPDPGGLVSCADGHALAQAAHDAFYEHRPLVLGPDAIWFCIAQGFAHHVNANAEALRGRFVRHEGKRVLVVMRPDIVFGQENPWPEVFGAFSELVAEHVGGVRDLLVADFSTTGPAERAASEIVLLDTFQAYFEYELRFGCGIPAFVLRGTPADWRRIRDRAALLEEWDLAWWIRPLLPVLDKLVAAAEGEEDRAFWRSFFRYDAMSGPAAMNGWIHVLFPYLQPKFELVRSEYVADWARRLDELEVAEAQDPRWWTRLKGPDIGSVPGSLASAPMVMEEIGTGVRHDMRLVGGMFGVRHTADGLEPVFGWAVVHGAGAGTRFDWRDAHRRRREGLGAGG